MQRYEVCMRELSSEPYEIITDAHPYVRAGRHLAGVHPDTVAGLDADAPPLWI